MGDYNRNRKVYKDISGTAVLAAGDGDTDLVSAVTGYTIFIQRLKVVVKTDAAQSCSFEDSASTPVKLLEIPTSPGASAEFTQDWGPKGIALTEAKKFFANVSAAGLKLLIHWEGYLKPTATLTQAQI